MKVVLLVLLSVFSAFSYAEPLLEHEASAVSKSASKIVEATINWDFKTVVDYMPQKLVDVAGGADKLIEMSAASFRELESNGMKISDFSYRLPQEKIVTSLNTIVLVPTQMEVKSDFVSVQSKSYLIAFQPRGQNDWQFVDASGIKNRKALEFLLPEYPKDEPVPQATHHVIEH